MIYRSDKLKITQNLALKSPKTENLRPAKLTSLEATSQKAGLKHHTLGIRTESHVKRLANLNTFYPTSRNE
jgi:hypothetical protein